MPDSLDQTIRKELDRYLRGDISLAEFEAWLIPETWDLSPQSDPKAHELATGITLRIAEFTSGDWSEDELRHQLRRLQAGPALVFSGGKDEDVILGSLGHLTTFSVAGTARSGAAA
jgi:hypothetical protein